MMEGGCFRLNQGGTDIDRSRPLEFRFDVRVLPGFEGDTLASALLANGIRTVARSFKLHRRRGLRAEGWDDPNAFVQLLEPWEEPNLLATRAPLAEGLVARGMHGWPNIEWDVGALANWLHALLPAGFYYKTFKWPGRAWPLYESLIRRAAGLGRAPRRAGGPVVERRHAQADVLVVGAGPAGSAAVARLLAAGCSVIWADDRSRPGGILGASAESADRAALDAIRREADRWGAEPTLRRLRSTVVLGLHDHGQALALERDGWARECLWMMRVKAVCLATGAFERGLPFENNDVPGVMMASAVRSALHRHAVAPGRQMVLAARDATDGSLAWEAPDAGMTVVAIVSPTLAAAPASLVEAARSRGVALIEGHLLRARGGRHGLSEVAVNAGGSTEMLPCDCLAISGGWNPALQLYVQAGGAARYDRTRDALRGEASEQTPVLAGAAAGAVSTDDCVASGRQAADTLLQRLAGSPSAATPPTARPSSPTHSNRAAQAALAPDQVLVDLAGDVTVSDIMLAAREGYTATELLKRYTTLGMGPDQGRSAGVDGLLRLAELEGRDPESLPPTRARPPFVPVAFGTLAGSDPGPLIRPTRETPVTGWHRDHGAVLYESGANWRRPGYYPRAGESMDDAVRRECRAVRQAVGVYDSTPLGKFEIGGPDAAAFLEQVLACRVSDLQPGRGRYALALRDDGRIFDDGTVFRLDTARYWLSSTAGNAEAMASWLEYARQWLFGGRLQVMIEPVGSHWADIVICGPRARELFSRLLEPNARAGLSAATFGFMRWQSFTVAGIDARVFRVSFTGELSYEICVPASRGLALWKAVMAAGADLGIEPVGSEANHLLRIEKGFISLGHEVDGDTNPEDLGMGWAVHWDKPEFIGRRSLERDRLMPAGRRQLVGLECLDEGRPFEEGAQVLASKALLVAGQCRSIGLVTASVQSEAAGRPIALALIEDGRAKIGETLQVTQSQPLRVSGSLPQAGAPGDAVPPGAPVKGLVLRAARVVAPIFYDTQGGRMRG
ncbi:MAG: 2Fe-2S iron-sulfur cluster-binding protein [Betaproteobacteria bacterium]